MLSAVVSLPSAEGAGVGSALAPGSAVAAGVGVAAATGWIAQYPNEPWPKSGVPFAAGWFRQPVNWSVRYASSWLS